MNFYVKISMSELYNLISWTDGTWSADVFVPDRSFATYSSNWRHKL